jgi:hypothetical protein
MQSGPKVFYVLIRMTRSIKIKKTKDVIFSSFERVEEFDESVSHGEMLERVMDWHASELDHGWCMMWKIISERDAKKFRESRKYSDKAK